jgi:hypothetical protein
MKLKSHPGFAIPANLSLDKHNSMGLLYEANWMNTNERIRQSYSKSNVNLSLYPSSVNSHHESDVSSISSLGQYQKQLEQVKAFEADQKHNASVRTIRDFQGYKPSTLKSTKSFKQHNEWDNEPKTKPVIHNPLYNHSQNNWHSTDYLSNVNNNSNHHQNPKRTDQKLKRSQTVIVKQPSAAEKNFQGDIDLRDFYQRRKQLEESKVLKDFGFGVQRNCDSMSINNDSLHRDGSNNLSALVRSNSNNRMNCYKTLNFFAPSKSNFVVVEESENGENGKVPVPPAPRALLNPLARNKSIKINHFDMVTTAKEPQKLRPEEIDGKLCDFSSGEKKVKKKNSFSRMFYNTISAGSKFPRVLLGRKNQRTKLNLEELCENAELPSSNSNSSVSTLSTSSIDKTLDFSRSQPRKNGSATSSDSDSFVIPRPRLIVPVHTYARKRRTGFNLTDQSINKANCDRNTASKGNK